MRLVLEIGHRRLTVAIEHDEPEPAEHHDSELDAYVERADHRDANPRAELDHRTRIGFH